MSSDIRSSTQQSEAGSPRYRQVSIGHPPIEVREEHGILHMRALEPLAPLPDRLLDRLVHWASVRAQQTFIAARDSRGGWRKVSYADMLTDVRAIAQSLLAYGLSAERPLALLSGNDIEHLQIALGAMYAGIPYCPVSPAYSVLSQDFAKLRHVCEVLQPGLVFVSDAAPFQRAIDAVITADTPVITVRGQLDGRRQLSFASLLEQPGGSEADAAFMASGPDSIAKFLFTSGSTKLPKAVVTTQRMLCANQQMLLQTFPVLGEEPPVLVDWLPWNHTFGGSHNLGIVLYNGGTFYLDNGKPTVQGFAETLRNLKEISPTAYLTVPKGWEELVNALEQDAELRAILLAHEAVLLRRCRFVAKYLGPPRPGGRTALWRAHPHDGRAGHDRGRTVLHLYHRAAVDGRLYRLARAGVRGVSGAGGRQTGRALSRPAHHARLLAFAAADRRGVRRERLLLFR
ncbi:Acyl-CoA synthetase [Pseudomonas syringae pv. actinidiae]|uniref:Acyl-CoA synthetase n=1 Tax=Pseudomonas syringae pv. actinidiae TaxID=103796 RepID=A0AAN4Q871_PSESF|nr:Acyl-CoA synthetase [Pseudomonas syringae pv. actinidiae]